MSRIRHRSPTGRAADDFLRAMIEADGLSPRSPPPMAPVVKIRGIAAQRESTAKASGRRDVFSPLGARGSLGKVANVA